ncbi:helix-turn-helix transcriptional regulator [Streptomyces sp. NPDC004732]|uniref:helix-turn-helix domain-containing protein n=1 Tax=Streptomyces sp. NPDC004732 TaxID=3154290 RepID=UPI0033BAA203
MGANAILQERMGELGVTQDELADLCNQALLEITGRPGDMSSRTIRNLLSGATRRPIGRTCAALERVFGCPVADLGFSAPSTMKAPEDPLRRRDFIAATTGTAVATAVPIGRQRRSVGMTDVQRASAGMNKLVEADDRLGGHRGLAATAIGGRAKILELQQRNASESVRRALYGLAAEYTTIAAWACIDLRDLDTAQHHLHESTTFAGLSQDAATGMRVWINVAMLAYQRRNWPEQLAAAQAASASKAARTDAFFNSMGRVRLALAHSSLGDPQAAQRALDAAQNTFSKAPDVDRPRWTAFYGPAELNHLAAIILNHSGESAEAEAMAHRALAAIPPDFQRNRALATCQLALAQLRQGEPEQATGTATTIFQIMNGAPLPGRMRTLIGDFHRDLLRLAPTTTYARDWADRMRDEWSQGA